MSECSRQVRGRPLAALALFLFCTAMLLCTASCSADDAKTAAAKASDAANAKSKTDAAQMSLGMNLSGVVDWSREWAFVDVFKASRPWIAQNVGGAGPWDTRREIKTTPEGWPLLEPGEAAATLLCHDTGGHYPKGEYICTYRGAGEIAFGFDAKVVRREPGRIVLAVDKPTDGGILLRIDRSAKDNPIRDIRVVMGEFASAKSAFHPKFVERLKPFRVLRFMDWSMTNNHGAVDWATRTRPDSIRQSGPEGVAIEHMVDLCNELGADPWFCMPHLAGDDYVRAFAKLVHDRLRPEAKIYVEWSNEAWNGQFAQARWVQDQAKARKQQWTVVIADEARKDWRVWRDAFGADATRIIRVAAGQHVNPWVCETIADRLAGDFDALSCAGYFYPQDKDVEGFTAQTTAEQVMRSALANIEEQALPMLARHRKLAETWSKRTGRHIPLVLYEAGQHLSVYGQDKPYAKAFLDAQRHPLMKEAYQKLLTGAKQERVELFGAFAYVGAAGKWGSWGHLTYQDEPASDAPKFEALLEAAGGPSR